MEGEKSTIKISIFSLVLEIKLALGANHKTVTQGSYNNNSKN